MNQNHINRRAFIKKSIEYTAVATFGIAGPWFQENAIAKKQGSVIVTVIGVVDVNVSQIDANS